MSNKSPYYYNPGFRPIDRGIKRTLDKLNNQGYDTLYSCVGIKSQRQLNNSEHSSDGYIYFAAPLPRKIITQARKLGLQVNKENNQIRSGAVKYGKVSSNFAELNKSFVRRINLLFGF